jgi:hypothetical protein
MSAELSASYSQMSLVCNLSMDKLPRRSHCLRALAAHEGWFEHLGQKALVFCQLSGPARAAASAVRCSLVLVK